ncbi:MAG: bifunctional ornithine acetyltransferase/N-acetylglutamate synthase [Oscillospiraceae bacterium]
MIGQPLDLAPIRTGLPQLAAALGDHSDQAAEGIMTTDTQPKEIAVQFTAGGKTCTIGGIAKGSGMIHPNLATMLVFLTTGLRHQRADAARGTHRRRAGHLQHGQRRRRHVHERHGRRAGKRSRGQCRDHRARRGLHGLLPRAQQRDRLALPPDRGRRRGRDAPDRVLRHRRGKTTATAKTVAKSIVCSSLVKAAMFGADANWGRVLCAIGYSGTRCGRAQGRRRSSAPRPARCACAHDGAGIAVFRGGSQTGPARKGDRDPRRPQRRRRGRHGVGLRPDI